VGEEKKQRPAVGPVSPPVVTHSPDQILPGVLGIVARDCFGDYQDAEDSLLLRLLKKAQMQGGTPQPE
jgi:hypothetical protein